jgi:transcriptional regulator with XRE-family HTH domain
MPIRRTTIDEATRRSKRQYAELVGELRMARHGAGLSQAAVGRAIGVSRPMVGAWERNRHLPTPIQIGRWGAAVGLDVSIRAFPGGAPLRDIGQLRLLERFRILVGDRWTWRTEVALGIDPSDRRAIDAVMVHGRQRIGVEAITRLVDAQAQVRPILLKEQASGIRPFVLLLADTTHNRAALALGDATIRPAFPCPPRAALSALREGISPPDNAVVFA